MSHLIQVTPEIDFSFDSRANTVQDVVLAPRVRTVDWETAVLSLKLHAKGSWSSTSSRALVMVQNAAQAPEDPEVLFVGSTLATATIANLDAAPQLYTVAFTGPIGPMVRVILRWEQLTVAATAAQTFSISVDLVGRS